jgi:hypothetical protein
MRQALPVMREAAETLQQRRQREPDGRKKPRLQMRYLLASGQAQSRRDVAQLLGVHRHTLGHWLAGDAAGGLDPLLALYVPAGQPLSLAPAGRAASAPARRQPAGVASDEALRQWVKQTPQRDVNDHPLYTSVRPQFQAKRTGPRPSHTKNP